MFYSPFPPFLLLFFMEYCPQFGFRFLMADRFAPHPLGRLLQNAEFGQHLGLKEVTSTQ